MVLSSSDWRDYNDDSKVLGTRLSVGIVSDKTEYRRKDGDNETNRFEKIYIKIGKNIDVPENAYISLINPTGAVYGEKKDQLSVTCDDVKVLVTKKE